MTVDILELVGLRGRRRLWNWVRSEIDGFRLSPGESFFGGLLALCVVLTLIVFGLEILPGGW